MRETWVQSLGLEDPLEAEMARIQEAPSKRESVSAKPYLRDPALGIISLSKAGVALVHPLTGSLNPGYFTAPGISVIMVVSGSRLIAGSVSL